MFECHLRRPALPRIDAKITFGKVRSMIRRGPPKHRKKIRVFCYFHTLNPRGSLAKRKRAAVFDGVHVRCGAEGS